MRAFTILMNCSSKKSVPEGGNFIEAVKKGGASNEIEKIVRIFNAPKKLAENINNPDTKILLDYGHIQQSIAFYLDKAFIENNINDFIMVGAVEDMAADLKKLENILKIKIKHPRVRKDTAFSYQRFKQQELSSKAITNLKRHYRKDYGIIALMKEKACCLGII